MVDFSRTEFDKAIKLTVDKKIEFKSKYPLQRLGDLLLKVEGNQTKVAKEDILSSGSIPVITQEASSFITGYTEEQKVITDLPLIVFGDHSCTFKYVDFEFVRGADGTQLIKVNNQNLKYIYEFLCSVDIDNKDKYERHFKYLKDVKIPLPPLDIQAQIVSECKKVDEEYNNNQINIEKYRKEIAEVFDELDNKATKDIRLSNTSLFDISIGRRILNSEVNQKYNIPVYSANVFEPFGMIDKLLIEDFSVDSVIWGIDGDWMVNVIPANHTFYPTDHCGVLRIKANDILPKYMAHLLEEEGKKVGFKRSYRASIDRIESLSVKIAPIEQQHNAISKIESYEAEIAKAKAVMEGCAERKKQILEKYLQ
jgi:restriction endonuclease S subunit